MVAAALAVLFFALPVVGLLGRVEWSTLWADLGSTEVRQAIWLSLACSATAAAFCAILGLPLAWVLARVEFPGRSMVRALVMLPLVLPPVVGGVALLSAFSRTSPVGRLLFDWFGVQLTFSAAGVVMAQTFVALPFFVITVESGIRAIDARIEDAAANLGAGRWNVAGRVTMPLAGPSILVGTVLSWARALGEFGATITFAGNVAGRTRTLPIAVYLHLDSKPQAAYAMSLVLLVVSMLVIGGLRDHWLGGLRQR